jgi:hypothetical protein
MKANPKSEIVGEPAENSDEADQLRAELEKMVASMSKELFNKLSKSREQKDYNPFMNLRVIGGGYKGNLKKFGIETSMGEVVPVYDFTDNVDFLLVGRDINDRNGKLWTGIAAFASTAGFGNYDDIDDGRDSFENDVTDNSERLIEYSQKLYYRDNYECKESDEISKIERDYNEADKEYNELRSVYQKIKADSEVEGSEPVNEEEINKLNFYVNSLSKFREETQQCYFSNLDEPTLGGLDNIISDVADKNQDETSNLSSELRDIRENINDTKQRMEENPSEAELFEKELSSLEEMNAEVENNLFNVISDSYNELSSIADMSNEKRAEVVTWADEKLAYLESTSLGMMSDIESYEVEEESLQEQKANETEEFAKSQQKLNEEIDSFKAEKTKAEANYDSALAEKLGKMVEESQANKAEDAKAFDEKSKNLDAVIDKIRKDKSVAEDLKSESETEKSRIESFKEAILLEFFNLATGIYEASKIFKVGGTDLVRERLEERAAAFDDAKSNVEKLQNQLEASEAEHKSEIGNFNDANDKREAEVDSKTAEYSKAVKAKESEMKDFESKIDEDKATAEAEFKKSQNEAENKYDETHTKFSNDENQAINENEEAYVKIVDDLKAQKEKAEADGNAELAKKVAAEIDETTAQYEANRDEMKKKNESELDDEAAKHAQANKFRKEKYDARLSSFEYEKTGIMDNGEAREAQFAKETSDLKDAISSKDREVDEAAEKRNSQFYSHKEEYQRSGDYFRNFIGLINSSFEYAHDFTSWTDEPEMFGKIISQTPK